jgi:hypothetical protein
MSEEIVAIKIFSDELQATMAQQALQDAGVRSFVFKDDAGGMEPHLQRTMGVRLVVNRANADRAHEILQSMES